MYLNNSLRLIVGGGSDIIRAGVRRMLSDMPEIEIIEECADAKSTMDAIRSLRPDVVMVDFYMNPGSAVEVLQECRAVRPRPVAIVHTQFADAGTRAISYAAGADVYYDNGSDLTPLVKMLRKLAAAMLDIEAEKMIA